ncbi:MAG: acyltransferase [Weeksellaceae bacterium]|nr:acyltransferase [Weeksellaceae bacterium]
MYKSILKVLLNFIIRLLPETSLFEFKRFLYLLQGYKVGPKTRICSSARIFGAGCIEIGSNVWIGPEVMIISSSSIKIEDNVDISPRVYIGTGTHNIGDIEGRMAGKGISKDIIIKKGSWLGANSLIMPGVIVEEMNIVNSGAVVAKNFQRHSLLAGVPAKVIKDLNKERAE